MSDNERYLCLAMKELRQVGSPTSDDDLAVVVDLLSSIETEIDRIKLERGML